LPVSSASARRPTPRSPIYRNVQLNFDFIEPEKSLKSLTDAGQRHPFDRGPKLLHIRQIADQEAKRASDYFHSYPDE